MTKLLYVIIYLMAVVSRDVISVFFCRGGTILTDFLGGGQNMKKTNFVCKNTKNHYFSNSEGGANVPPSAPPKWRPWSYQLLANAMQTVRLILSRFSPFYLLINYIISLYGCCQIIKKNHKKTFNFDYQSWNKIGHGLSYRVFLMKILLIFCAEFF